MGKKLQRLQLIGNRRNAAIASFFTAVVAMQSIRSAFSHAARNPHWLISFDYISPPIWVVAIANLAFYGLFFWTGVELYRVALGKERIVVVGWLSIIFLGGFQNLVSAPQASAIQWVKATGITAAFLTATYIFFTSPAATEGLTKTTKHRLLVLCAVLASGLVLGAAIYFLPKR